MAPPHAITITCAGYCILKVILFGATGMIGAGALIECFGDSRVERVLAVVRKPTGSRHSKLEEVVHTDFNDYAVLRPRWADFDACLFCLGVTSVGMDEASYRRITFDFTLAAARSMVDVNPAMVFCYVSGAGTDAGSSTMWRRVKGETENMIGPLYPLLRRVAPGAVTNTETLGRALIRVAADGYPTRVLEGRDINVAGDTA